MIDAGTSNAPTTTSSQPRPNDTMRPGQWIGRYLLRHVTASQQKDYHRHSLDYFIATHYHPDHIGDVNGDSTPLAANGAYRLTGVSDVDAIIPIKTIIDRAYPHYETAPPPGAPFSENYIKFLNSIVAEGRAIVQSALVGSDTQIHLCHMNESSSSSSLSSSTSSSSSSSSPSSSDYASLFHTRILASNGVVWGGPDHPALQHIVPLPLPNGGTFSEENVLSIAIRIDYGAFSYYNGGDLLNHTCDGRFPWMDVETPTARACGRVEVASANHHGYFDACGSEFVRHLDAQAYIIQSWDVGHPGTEQMQRLLGAWPNKATRDVFALDVLPANRLINRRWADQLKSQHGHVIIRVARGGDSYFIFVTDSNDEQDIVKDRFGPYMCRR
eukprot:TRINITY_DN5423_c0_g1_i1.p1 TRINITY_DN5423_c0_g1~~TRINITY_DN5423_c0_g1_i1.p1  ORF type:complete len:430 (+),score=73.13 TRINITY_DN5423_c0_g1_i1:137-1291(+)